MRATRLHTAAALLDAIAELRAIERDMRGAAAGWLHGLQSRRQTPEQIAAVMRSAGAEYRKRVARVTALRAGKRWADVLGIWRALGGTEADIVDVSQRLEALAIALSGVGAESVRAIADEVRRETIP